MHYKGGYCENVMIIKLIFDIDKFLQFLADPYVSFLQVYKSFRKCYIPC